MLLGQGCTGPALQMYPAGNQETAATLAAFSQYRQKTEAECVCCIDAEADVTLSVSGWFSDRTGKISGYLQARKPGFIKFIAVNPLGQPLFIFTTDGKMFKSLDVFGEKAYLGSVHSETYEKFAPTGFEPENSFYWLTGRLGSGEVRIGQVMRSENPETYWLEIIHADSDSTSMVLFDPEEMVILRHVLLDPGGRHLIDLRYAGYQFLPGNRGTVPAGESAAPSLPAAGGYQCRVPKLITASSKGGDRQIEIELHAFLDDVHFSAADFHVEIPSHFEHLLVR